MQEAAAAAASALEMKAGRRKVTVGAGTEFPRLHLAEWGPPKVRKTSLALRARTSEVRLPSVTELADPNDPFGDIRVVQQGQVLIPSKPIPIAYANFDRDARTVFRDLPADVDIVEEILYQLPDGSPLVLGGPREYQQLTDRFLTFVEEVLADGTYELLVCDGGTILWENVRAVLLDPLPPGSKDAEGQPRHAARQYGPSNKYMRETVMKRLYNLPLHTVITRESRERWAGQNAAVVDLNEPGGVALGADGWNKTGHYVDHDMQLRLVKNPGQPEVWTGIAHMSIQPNLIGVPIRDPSFSGIYEKVMQLPLLLAADQPLFDQLKAEHEKLEWGAPS